MDAPVNTRINRVDIPVLLTLFEGDELFKIWVHPEVPMRDYFLAKINPVCIASKPMEATHILLDLLPPHPSSSLRPNAEQQGYLSHRGDRKVLCGYWAQECLRIASVAEMGFWDLSVWDRTPREGSEIKLPETQASVREVSQAVVDDPSQLDSIVIDDYSVSQSAGPSVPDSAERPRKRPQSQRDRTARSSTTGDAHIPITIDDESEDEDYLPSTSETGRHRELCRSTHVQVRPGRAKRKCKRKQQSHAHPDPDESDIDRDLSNGPHSLSPVKRARPLQADHKNKDKAKAKKTKLKRPTLEQMTPEELHEMWDYFLAMTSAQLDRPVPDAKMGTVDVVKQWMMVKVHRMWVEARAKYCRRNLDHMSVMLSTWKTARDFQLSPLSLRTFYTQFKGKIIADKGTYVPVGHRPPNWPFHDRPPVNAEAAAPWIHDWTSRECLAFQQGERWMAGLGWDQSARGGELGAARREEAAGSEDESAPSERAREKRREMVDVVVFDHDDLDDFDELHEDED